MTDPFEVIDVVRTTIHHSGSAGDETSSGQPSRMRLRCESCEEEFVATPSRKMTPGTFSKGAGGYLVVCQKGKHRGLVLKPDPRD
jgi:hypothetical protein